MKMNKSRGWEMTEELDAIRCPHCGGYNRLSVSVDYKSIYCAECGSGITAAYLLTQGFALEQWCENKPVNQ